MNPPDNRTIVDEDVIRFFEPVNREFDQSFADDSQVVGDFSYEVDVRVRTDIGRDTPVYATSGRTLIKIQAANGSQVFIRNAQVQHLDGNMMQITFNRGEQISEAQQRLRKPEMQKDLDDPCTTLEDKLFIDTATKLIDEDGDDEEYAPVFVLWEGGGIEEFKNDDEARDEIMAMDARGCKHMKFSSREEAESALQAMASAFNKK